LAGQFPSRRGGLTIRRPPRAKSRHHFYAPADAPTSCLGLAPALEPMRERGRDGGPVERARRSIDVDQCSPADDGIFRAET
jgi:hypothetical protein